MEIDKYYCYGARDTTTNKVPEICVHCLYFAPQAIGDLRHENTKLKHSLAVLDRALSLVCADLSKDKQGIEYYIFLNGLINGYMLQAESELES